MKEISITFKNINFLVFGNYEGEEDSVSYYTDLSGYPGSLASFEITKICAEDSQIDLYELFSDVDLNLLEEEIIEKLN